MIHIIIATFNSDKTLSQCLNSILEQNFNDYNVFIKDGKSTDNTISIINQYQSKFNEKLNYISTEDSGVYDAWNIALNYVNDGWVTFLGSDDYLSDNNALMRVYTHLLDAEKQSIELVYGKNIIIDDKQEVINELGENWDIAKNKINQNMSIRHPGSFCTVRLIKKLNAFDNNFKIIGDYDFILRAIQQTDVYYYNFAIVYHRIGGLSISPSRTLDVIKETYNLRKKQNLKPYFNIDKLFIKRMTLYIFSIFLSDKKILNLIKGFKKK
ncbi:TPA: glycosyltransferase [Providencia rettgeri]|nr:glycosyltransferase [Providencia rettgeri]